MKLFGINIGKQQREVVPAIQSTGVPSSSNEQPKSTNSGSYQERKVWVSRPEQSLASSVVYRAVSLKSKTIAQMEMQYQRKDKAGKCFVESPMMGDCPINWLLQKRPNPMMTGAELFQQMVVHRELLGNAYIYIERNLQGDPENLWLAVCGGYNPITDTYTLTYNTNHGMRNKFEAPAEDVIHWRNTFRTMDGYMGIPTHCYAIMTLSLIATQKQLAIETAAKGGRMKVLIGENTDGQVAPIGNGRYDPKEMTAYAKEVEQRLYNNDVVALHDLDKVINISLTAQDMQMIEQLNISLDDLARYYETPRPLLMLDTNSHYNDYTNATMEYLQRTIAPLARELEDLFDVAFLTQYDFGSRRFHLCELPLLRMDMERQAKVDEMRLRMGWTANEIRSQYDMPSLGPIGDIPYISTNLAELGSKKLSGEDSTELKPGTYTVKQPNNDDNGKQKDSK